MKLSFEIDEPSKFTSNQLDDFLRLLTLQAQISNPNLEKINASSLICIAYFNGVPIGIGAIKQVYKSPFDKAEVSTLKDQFDFELGYLFVIDDRNYRGLGIGKTISKLLLKKLGNKNVFATTDESDENVMKFILQSLNFKKVGKTYIGTKTHKSIGLYLKNV